MRHKKLISFSFFFVISFLFFSSSVLGIVNENDINFNWISTIIYDENELNDFTIDDSLNHTIYNDTDYYEHVNDFDSKNYSFYYIDDDYLISIDNRDLIYYNDSFCIFPIINGIEDQIYFYDDNFSLIANITNPLLDFYDINDINLESITNDDIYVYILFYVGINYYIMRFDYNMNYINTVLTIESNEYHSDPRSLTYMNNSLYFGVLEINPLIANKIYQYDLNGYYIQKLDISAKVSGTNDFIFDYYMNYFYMWDKYDDDIHIYDNDFNFIETLSRTFSNGFDNMLIKDDLVFYIDATNFYIHVINLTFESNSNYDIVDYYPNEYGLFDSVDNVNITLQEQTNPLGYYQAIYNFDDINELNNFSINQGVGNNVDLNDIILNHKNVLDLYDNNASSEIYLTILNDDYFISGCIEFWFLSNNATNRITFTSYDQESATYQIYIKVENNALAWYEESVGWHNIATINDNVWYHLRINFTESYQYQIDLNNQTIGIYDFRNDYYSERFRFNTDTNDYGYHYYFDALGLFNMTNGNYSASYDMDYNNYDNWIYTAYEDANCWYEHVDFSYGHNDTIRFIDNNTSGIYQYRTLLLNSYNSDNGSVEFWYLSENQNSHYMYFYGNLGREFTLQWYSNDIKITDATGNHYLITGTYPNNEWIHYNFEYDFSNRSCHVYLDNLLLYTCIDFQANSTCFASLLFLSHSSQSPISQLDGLGFTCLSNYTLNQNLISQITDYDYDLNQNLQYGLEYNGFYNEVQLLNQTINEILSIECLNGTYYINDVSTEYNVFFNESNVYDTWILSINVNQLYSNGTMYLYNTSWSLLYNQTFNCLLSNDIKYIKYNQYYQDSNHFIYLSNFSIESNYTKISGNNGFMSYELDLIDTDIWDFSVSNLLTINAYGRYKFYVSNDTYGSENASIYPLTSYYDFRSEDISFVLDYLDYQIINPYLIVETINGMFLLDSFKIEGSITSWLLYDSRGYVYNGYMITSNINSSISYFSISENRLYYTITFDDSYTESMKLVFEIQEINNENYQLLYGTYLNDSDTTIISQIKLKNNDGSYTNIDLSYLYDSNIEILEQDKKTHNIEFYISDNDLQENKTISGYFESFTFNYSEVITFSLFVNAMLDLLVPFLIILPMTFAISHSLRNKDTELLNKKAFFPVFLIISIIVFILGFFETWILFSIIICAIAYIVKKRDDF